MQDSIFNTLPEEDGTENTILMCRFFLEDIFFLELTAELGPS